MDNLKTDKIMQYNQVFNSQIGNNQSRQEVSSNSKGQNPVGASGRSSVNNIFSRNVVNSSITGIPSTNTQVFTGTTTSNSSIPPSLPTFNFSTTSANNPVASNGINSNPFFKPNSTTSNNFGGSSTQANAFSSNFTQIGNNNASLLNNNLNSNKANNFSNSFNTTANQKPFTQQFTNTTLNNAFANQNSQKPPNPAFSSVQTANNLNQNLNNSKYPNKPITNQIFNSPQQSITGVQNDNFSTSIQFPTNNQFPQQNVINQRQISQVDIPQSTTSQPQLQRLMQKMNFNNFNMWDNPYSLYNSQLMIENLYRNINKKIKKGSKLVQKQYQTKVKDSPYKTHILFLIKQMIDTSDYINYQRENANQLEKKADQLARSFKQKLVQSKCFFIQKLKLERLIKQIQSELCLIEAQLFNFVRPLLQAYEAKMRIQFEDPDDFSIEIAKIILAKICLIQKNINKITAESTTAFVLISNLDQFNSSEAKRAILQLMAYFEEICIKFQTLKEKYESYRIKPSQKVEQSASNAAQQINMKVVAKIRTILANRASKIETGFSMAPI